MSKKIAVIGECMIELSQKGAEVSRGFGGDTLNTSVYIARQVAPEALSVDYVTALGTDSFSQQMLEAWQNEHVGTALIQRMENRLPGLYYIETDSTGERTFYYWRNEAAAKFWLESEDAAAICEALGADAPGTFTEKTLSPFYGAYYGQAALPMAPDTLTYLESADTKAAEVTGPELDGAQPVYRPELLDGTDGYDVFLSGAQAVLTVTSPNVHNGRHLVLFRDSFGSSLAPLLLGSFERITLVDLRYISAARLTDYADLSDATDVLYLCSTAVWNNGGTLRE